MCCWGLQSPSFVCLLACLFILILVLTMYSKLALYLWDSCLILWSVLITDVGFITPFKLGDFNIKMAYSWTGEIAHCLWTLAAFPKEEGLFSFSQPCQVPQNFQPPKLQWSNMLLYSSWISTLTSAVGNWAGHKP